MLINYVYNLHTYTITHFQYKYETCNYISSNNLFFLIKQENI